MINLILLFLCRITSKDAVFELRLHLIYLMNDLLHHWWVNYHQPTTILQQFYPLCFNWIHNFSFQFFCRVLPCINMKIYWLWTKYISNCCSSSEFIFLHTCSFAKSEIPFRSKIFLLIFDLFLTKFHTT